MHAAATTSSTPLRRGFTLIEILVVVLILGLLAALIIPAFGNSVREAEQAAFVKDIKVFNEAAMLYMFKTHSLLADSNSGEVPAGFEDYIDERAWTSETPIGGLWDSELNNSGITSGIGVHFDGTGITRDDAYMTEVDGWFDDGDLATGAFRKITADRYYVVLED